MRKYYSSTFIGILFSITSAVAQLTVGPPNFVSNQLNFTPWNYWSAWMQDPLEATGSGKVWVMPSYYNYGGASTLLEYSSINNLQSKVVSKSYVLPYTQAGTGSIVYDGNFYFVKADSRTLIKYDLRTETVKSILDLPNAGIMNTYPWNWGGYSDISFAIDETGLYVIYATPQNNGNVVISKLNISDFSIGQSWNTSIPKNWMVGTGVTSAFMVNGTLYAIGGGFNTQNNSIVYQYNTGSASGSAISIPINFVVSPNGGTYITQVLYNPLNKLLYVWNDGSLYNYTTNGPGLNSSISTQQLITSINTSNGIFCSGDKLIIDFKTLGTFSEDNSFTAELSNGGGQWGGNSPDLIQVSLTPTGTVTENGVAYTTYRMITEIPIITTGQGTIDHYQVRINASADGNGNPVEGEDYLYNNTGFTINPVPDIQTVTGGGSYCSNQAGVVIGLDDSQTDVNYLLYHYASETDSTLIASIAGNGSAISFDPQTQTGLYKVKAVFTNGTGCGTMMNGSATIDVNSAPDNTTVPTAEASPICPNSATNIQISTSVSGINYQLRIGTTDVGNAVPGNGGLINLPTGNLTTTTTFNILAINATTSCSAQITTTVTITVQDNTLPVVTAPTVASSYNVGESSCTASLSFTATATDACGVANIKYYLNYGRGTESEITFPYAFAVGSTVVTAKATDVNGNVGTVNFTVNVVDNQNPVTTLPSVSTSYNTDNNVCTRSLTFTATATDNCGTPAIKYYLKWGTAQQSEITTWPYAFPKGSTTVTVVATDINNLTDVDNFVVVVVDNQKPVNTLPTVAGSYNTDNNLCTTSLNLSSTASDNCGTVTTKYYLYYGVQGEQTEITTWPYAFPKGSTEVTMVSTDESSNTDIDAFTVNVVDAQPPVNTLPTVSTYYNTDFNICTTSLSLSGSASDNCGSVTTKYYINYGTPQKQEITFPYVFAKGSTTVTMETTDGSGNTDTDSYVVTVEDHQAPVNTVASVAYSYNTDNNLCSASLSFTGSASDNCTTVTTKYYIKYGMAGQTEITFPYAFSKGSTEVAMVTTDGSSNTDVDKFTVNVADNQNPTITAPSNVSVPETDAGQCTKTGVNLGTPSTTDNCPGQTYKAYVGSTEITPASYPFPFGTTTVTWVVTDASGNTASATQDVTVQKVKTTTTVTVNPTSQQYSDKVTYTATVAPYNCSGAGDIKSTAGKVVFKIGTFIIGEAPVVNGVATLSNQPLLEDASYNTVYYTSNITPSYLNPTDGPLKPGAKTVTACYVDTDPDYVVTNPTTPLTITCEDADVTYTGGTYYNVNPTTLKGTVFLSANVVDRNDAPAQARGDIRNATANFKNGGSSGTAIGERADIPVGLVDPSNKQEGVANTNFGVQLTTQQASGGGQIYNVWVGASNYYCGGMAGDYIPVTIGMPGQDFVTGGGYITLTNNVSGKYGVGAGGMRMNGGLVMKWNSSGKNLQGQVNIIFRRMENGTKKIYQIKSNAINTLIVENVDDNGNPATGTAIKFRRATINTKANLTDITDPMAPASLGGNLDLLVTAWESTTVQTGALDRIGVQVTGSGSIGVLFSSNWSGGKTVAQTLNGGKMQVRDASTAPLGQVTLSRQVEQTMALNSEMQLNAYPNPSSNHFKVQLKTDDKLQRIQLRVTDASGRIIQLFSGLSTGQVIEIGNNYRPGVYIIEMIQGNEHKQLKLVKIPD